MDGDIKKKFIMPVHSNVECPKCHAGIAYGITIVGKDDIECPHCSYIFSYEDGIIAKISNLVESSDAEILFTIPLCAGVIESDTVNISIGKSTKVFFNASYDDIYTLQIGSGEEPHLLDAIIMDEYIISPTNISNKGFSIISSFCKEEVLKNKVDVTYYVTGKDKDVKDVPMWIKFLQNVLDLIKKDKYGMAIIQSISAFDAYYDDFLWQRLERIKGYEKNRILNILRNENRRKKLYYYLYYVTNTSFEDSLYDVDLRNCVELRNKIVHPKKHDFDETNITKNIALKTLSTIIKSIGWINKIKIQE